MSNKNNYLDGMAILKEIGQLHEWETARADGLKMKPFAVDRFHTLVGEFALLLQEIFPDAYKKAAAAAAIVAPIAQPFVQPPPPLPQPGPLTPLPQGASLQDGVYGAGGPAAETEDERTKLVVFDRPLAEQLIKIAGAAKEALMNPAMALKELATPNDPIQQHDIAAAVGDAKKEIEKLSVATGDGKPTAIGNVALLTKLMDIASGVAMLPATNPEQQSYKEFASNVVGVAKKALMYTSTAVGIKTN